MTSSNSEVVCEGWLVKSPPTKRLWRAKWRRRWFVLRNSGELPGQYFLEYYTDRTCRKQKGRIDLDQCEQVDSGLTFESRKQHYAHMLDIRTPKRVFFLAADNEQEMNKWVDCVCQVCGLKVYTRDDEGESTSQTTAVQTMLRPPLEQLLVPIDAPPPPGITEETPPLSPISPTNSSGPYYPLSECLSGARSVFLSEKRAEPLPAAHTLLPPPQPASSPTPSSKSWAPGSGSAPVTPALTRGITSSISQSMRAPTNKFATTSSAKASKEEWSLFYNMPRKLSPTPPNGGHPSTAPPTTKKGPPVKWETYPLDDKCLSSSSPEPMSPQSFSSSSIKAPPRPPKPPYLKEQYHSHSYLNIDQLHAPRTSPKTPLEVTQDDMYDFPRSHQPESTPNARSSSAQISQRHCYNNAAPASVSSIGPHTTVFRYDFRGLQTQLGGSDGSLDSLRSPKIPHAPTTDPLSPMLPPLTPAPPIPPPVVNRTLKPRRNSGDVPSVPPAPSVNRQLKPKTHDGVKLAEVGSEEDEPSSRQSSRRNSASDEQIYYYVQGDRFVSSPPNKRIAELHYLDLDLDSEASLQSPRSPERVPPSSTVYRTVDFVKTDAFNRTRETVEKQRNKNA